MLAGMAPPLPHAFDDQDDRTRFLLLIVAPSAFGIVTGLMLGVSEPVYLLLQLVGILGGFVAGLEMSTPIDGFYRGIMGGMLFGFWILFTHGIVFDAAPKANLPDPEVALIAITTGFGALLGWLGARRRVRVAVA
jgi:hypothetical protein